MSVGVAVLGSGNIGTDLMIKVLRLSDSLRMVAMAGIDPDSDGLARARRLGVTTTAEGVAGLVALPEFADVALVFDATSAGAHRHHDAVLRAHGRTVVDLTPAAVGPYVVPPVNLDEHLRETNVNMVTCGGQATVPIVAAVGRVTPVTYGEIVASIAAKSAGPGTRANIDEFTETTARAIEVVGGAELGKAIIVLNPADPPLLMRDTVYCLCPDTDADRSAIAAAIADMVRAVQEYVPGYCLKQDVQFDRVDSYLPALGRRLTGLQVSTFLEVSGAGHYLPTYAGNLDIMTSAALRTAERLIARRAVTA
ncbi:acetaldehyde dehydrogenase (acetylating) [Salinispora tropica]|uniref:Acetaldehyde dehydrogenase n=1 Tax=Salinispora tropica (strain ATCC BAA-916 / DSM 44818 / JCM 13857 / NBRC 105044 / CNB-440) TaxID=369723 RepID=ACDH_SALTO|nr:acetaldehyde dehydrogenase (acetylating) [Salinispora tropica]A4XAK8.1 RecName: Full=Acetaldehyde dehydrogenase; AltName: Full=Acetaldehyde dehydrogenase [acetylating] [Salinispora tropica CNB-440]ABP55957.1 Semialdehyde dehydrogenase, NAD - binding [Salinispora tropica CNB-440]